MWDMIELDQVEKGTVGKGCGEAEMQVFRGHGNRGIIPDTELPEMISQ